MQLSPVGYFIKAHGLKGQLILKEDASFDLKKLRAVFIETAGAQAPFFVKEIKDSNNGLIVSLEDIDTIDKARPLLKKQVLIDSALIEEEEEGLNWLGFEVIDKEYGNLGKVEGVNDNGEQVLLSLTFRNREIILPLAEDFIVGVDEEKKILKYDAPAGLIEIYLEGE